MLLRRARAGPAKTSSPYGAPLAAFEIPGAPLPACPAIAGAGGVKDIDPSLRSQAGGCPPEDSRDTIANRVRGRRSPSTLSLALQSVPQRMGMIRKL